MRFLVTQNREGSGESPTMTYKSGVSSLCIIYPVVYFCAVCFAVTSANADFMGESGDRIIGGLFAMRSAGTNGKCDKVDYKGLLTTQAMLYAINEINTGRHIDLKAKLGYEVWDTCAGPRTFNLVTKKRNASLSAVLGTLPRSKQDKDDSVRVLFIHRMPFLGCDPTAFTDEDFFDVKTIRSFTLQAVPSDRRNLRALADVAAHFNWQYVSVVYMDDAAGKYAKKALVEEAKLKLCVGQEYPVPTASDDSLFIVRIVNRLKSDPNAFVVVLLTTPDVSTRLIAQASKQKVSKLVWLARDTSWDNKPFISSNSSAAGRLFTVGSYVRVLGFKAYLRGLSQSTIKNPWLLEAVRNTDGSQTPKTTAAATTTAPVLMNSSASSNDSGSATSVPATPTPTTSTIDTKKLQEVEERLTQMAEEAACTLDSVFAVAHALVAEEKCTSDKCPGLIKYLNAVDFRNPTTGHQVSFSAEGYLKQPEYQVCTYQKFDGDDPSSPEERTNLKREVIGTWKVSASGEPTLKIQEEKIRWGTESGKAPAASCPKPCPPGDYRARKKNRSDASCCWECLPCHQGSISRDHDTQECAQCPHTFRPNLARTQCVKYFEEFVLWSDPGSLVIIFLMVTGICFSIYVSAVLFRNRDTPVMRRAKNAPLALLPLVLVLFLIPTPLLSKPTDASCEGYRAFFTLALGVPLAALIARSHALAQVFHDDQGSRMACVGRVLVAGTVLIIHVVVVIILAVFLPSGVSRYSTDDPFTVYLECSMHPEIGLLAAVLYLLAVTVVVSVLSMNEPISDCNDAEVKWVSLCMFNWAALSFFHVVFAMGVPGEGKVFGMAVVDLLFASNVLVCLYMPKWYIVVFHPERNQVIMSPWSTYLSTQNKVSERLSANKEESPVTPRRVGLASTAKEAGGTARTDNVELQQLMDDTDV